MKKLKPIEETLVWKAFAKTERFILIVTSLLAAGCVFVGVIMRYVLHKDFFGQEEVVTVIAMWLYWIGGVYGSYEHSHIGADILSTLLPNKDVVHILDIVCNVLSIVVLVFFTLWSLDYVQWAIDQGAKSMGLKIPLIFSQLPLFVGFFMMLLYEIYQLIRLFKPYNPTAGLEGGAE